MLAMGAHGDLESAVARQGIKELHALAGRVPIKLVAIAHVSVRGAALRLVNVAAVVKGRHTRPNAIGETVSVQMPVFVGQGHTTEGDAFVGG